VSSYVFYQDGVTPLLHQFPRKPKEREFFTVDAGTDRTQYLWNTTDEKRFTADCGAFQKINPFKL